MSEVVANDPSHRLRRGIARGRGAWARLATMLLLACTASLGWAASLTLAWDVSAGAAGYRAYYGTTSGTYTASVDAGAATSVTISGLTSGRVYYFAVTAYNGSGAESSYSAEVVGTAPSTAPVASFIADKTAGAAPLTVAFDSSASTGTFSSYAWTFGDGGTSSAANPSHTYSATGTYTVALTLSGSAGSNTQTRTGYIVVSAAAPVAAFTANVTSGVAPLLVNFANASSGTITSYAWTFGDGGTSTAASPSHSFASAGTYSVALTVTGPGGSNTLTRSNYIAVSPASAPVLALVATPLDEHAVSGANGNLNGVIEPGETVMIEPIWRNDSSSPVSSVTGTLSKFTGPSGASYTISDGSASYGTIAAGAEADCRDASGNCYLVRVSKPSTRPVQHWDATLTETLSTGNVATITMHIGGSFGDVPSSDASYNYIETLLHNNVTTGFSNGTFGPTANSTRAQTAMFAARGLLAPEGDTLIPVSGKVGSASYNCASGGKSLYADVAPTDGGCKQVHYLAAQGINVTFGCSDSSHVCPTDASSRSHMSVLIAGAVAGGDANVPASGTFSQSGAARSYNCASGGSSHFPDVSVTSSYCKHVNYLWAIGVIDGFSDGTFQPATLVTRAQMAKFITAGFDLTLD